MSGAMKSLPRSLFIKDHRHKFFPYCQIQRLMTTFLLLIQWQRTMAPSYSVIGGSFATVRHIQRGRLLPPHSPTERIDCIIRFRTIMVPGVMRMFTRYLSIAGRFQVLILPCRIKYCSEKVFTSRGPEQMMAMLSGMSGHPRWMANFIMIPPLIFKHLTSLMGFIR